jgi:hypothetical protein
MEDFRPIRVGAVPGRHRGGLLESWQAYAEWLEQVVGIRTADQTPGDLIQDLPRERRLHALRISARESSVLKRRRRS